MRHLISAAILTALIFVPASAGAAERTVTLTVMMTCPTSDPPLVREALSRIDGVSNVEVSYADKSAYVTFDDAMASTSELVAAIDAIGLSSDRDAPMDATNGMDGTTRMDSMDGM